MRTVTATLDDRAAGGEAPPSTGLVPGRRLGPYELLLPLASGGMGHVWVAARVGEFGFRRKVAVKTMREELAASGEFRRRFLDEARIVADLAHTNVVQTIDLGIDGDVLYQAMELVDGASLAVLLKAHEERSSAPVEMEVAVRIVLDVLRGLHAVHELAGAGLVHRDVSTHNVLVGLDGVAKLTDFGIARAADGVAAHGAEGKLGFMAPEQLRGVAIDRRADVFAVGVIAWGLFVGEALGEPAARLNRGEALPSPPDHVPPALASITMRALAASPAERWVTAEAMADALERAAHDAGLVASPRSVASWAAPLASDQVARRNEEAETQLARSVHSAPDAANAVAPAGPRRSLVPFVAVAVGVALLGGIALAGLRGLGAGRDPLPKVAVSGPASGSTASGSASALASEPIVAYATASSDPPEPSARAAVPPAVHPTASARRPTLRPTSRPPASVDPKYQNPYAR